MRTTRRMICRLGTALALCLSLAGGLGPQPAAAAVRARTSLLTVEDALICVVCHEPLALAQSPEAQQERAIVEQLISRGETKAQIVRTMVADYGVAVLAKPPATGVNVLVYVLPPAVVAAGLLFLLLTLPRWRRRARVAAETPMFNAPSLSPADAARLQEDLARFD
jgi:cytochrome c-type biogenesis protein CcmH